MFIIHCRPDHQQSAGDSGKMLSYLNWMTSSAANVLNDYWSSSTSQQLSPSSSSFDSHPLTSCQLVKSCHPFYSEDFTTAPSSDNYLVLKPVDKSSGKFQLNQAILRTSLLLADHSQSSGDVNKSEWMISDDLILIV